MSENQQTVSTNVSNKQTFVKEIKRHYNLLCPKGDKPTPIIFVVSVNGKQVRFSAGVKVYPNQWIGERAKDYNLPQMEIENNKIANNALNLLDAKFAKFIAMVNDGEVELTQNNLLAVMGRKVKSAKADIMKDLYNGVDNSVKDGDIKESSARVWTLYLNSFEKYLKENEIVLDDYSKLTKALFRDFQNWRKNTSKAKNKQINKVVSGLTTMIHKYLLDADKITAAAFAEIEKLPKLKEENKVDDKIALLDDDIQKLYDYIPENETEEQVRDMFLMGCLTGQRHSDWWQLKPDADGILTIDQMKMGTHLQVKVLFQMALDIAAKYDTMPNIPNEKVNAIIKRVAKKAGIEGVNELNGKQRWECVTSHTGRRTFITLLALRDWNTDKICKYSGHHSRDMVALYDKDKFGDRMLRKYEELKREHKTLKMVGENDKPHKKASTPQATVSEVDRNVRKEIIREYNIQNRKAEQSRMGKIVGEIRKGVYKFANKDKFTLQKLILGGTIESDTPVDGDLANAVFRLGRKPKM